MNAAIDWVYAGGPMRGVDLYLLGVWLLLGSMFFRAWRAKDQPSWILVAVCWATALFSMAGATFF